MLENKKSFLTIWDQVNTRVSGRKLVYCYKVRENRDIERLAELLLIALGDYTAWKARFRFCSLNFSHFSNNTPKIACKSLILKGFYIVRVVFHFLTMLVSPWFIRLLLLEKFYPFSNIVRISLFAWEFPKNFASRLWELSFSELPTFLSNFV